MRHRNYINELYAFACLILLLKLCVAYVAVGGIDINVYLTEAWRVNYSNPRYYQEPVSWGIISGLVAALPYDAFVFGFSLTILLLGVVRLGIMGGIFLYIAFFSPFGVMLEFNVIRQCLGAVFLAFFMVDLKRGRVSSSLVFAVLAVLSHNSSLLIISFALFFHLAGRMDGAWRFITFAALIAFFIILNVVTGYNSLLGGRADSLRPDLLDGFENVIYLGFSLAFCGLLFWGAQQKKWRSMALGISVAVLFSAALALSMSLGSWVYGRIAITAVVICQFLLFYDTLEVGKVSPRVVMFLLSIAILNGVLILFHPGALSMIV